MGNITDSIASAFRDFVTDGVASSGAHEPIKADIRALGPLIETAIGNAGLGALVSVTKTTKALLDADLAHDADVVALVYADATDANNDLYVKTGASGAGSWANTGAFHAVIEPFGATAQAWAEGTLPGGAGTKSAKEWAAEAENYLDVQVAQAEAWAEGTLPGGAGTKSAKEHASNSAQQAVSAAASALTAQMARDQAADLVLPANIFVNVDLAVAEADVVAGTTFKVVDTVTGLADVRLRTLGGSEYLYSEATTAALANPTGEILAGLASVDRSPVDALPNETLFWWSSAHPRSLNGKVYSSTCGDNNDVYVNVYSRPTAPNGQVWLRRHFVGHVGNSWVDNGSGEMVSQDDHHAGGIAVRAGKPLVVFFSGHSYDNTLFYRATLKNIDDYREGEPLTFGPIRQIEGPPNTTTSYAIVILRDGDDTIRVLHRTGVQADRWAISSFPAWATGTPSTVDVFSSADQFYVMGEVVGDNLRCIISDHPTIGTDNKVWYASINLISGAITKTDGTVLGNLDGTNLPLAEASCELVYTATGTQRPWTFAVGTGADPEFVFTSGGTGGTNFGSTGYYYYAKFVGGAWVINQIAKVGAFIGGAYFPSIDFYPQPGAVVLARELAGTTFIEKYVTADHGATWTVTELARAVVATDTTLTRAFAVHPVDGAAPIFDVLTVEIDEYPNYYLEWKSRVRPLPRSILMKRLPDVMPAQYFDDPSYGLYLPGTAGTYISLPSPSLGALLDGIMLETDVALDSWNAAGIQTLFAKEKNGTNRSIRLAVAPGPGGQIGINYSQDGSTVEAQYASSLKMPDFADQQRAVVRFMIIPNLNGSQRKWRAWYRLPGIHTQFIEIDAGQLPAPSTISLFDSDSPWEIGGRWGGTLEMAAGVFFAVRVMTVGGTIVSEWRADRDWPRGIDQSGQKWTGFGEASIVAPHPTFSAAYNGTKPLMVGAARIWQPTDLVPRFNAAVTPASETQGHTFGSVMAPKVLTASGVALVYDDLIVLAGVSTIALTLPATSSLTSIGNVTKRYFIVSDTPGGNTIAPNTGQTINGSAASITLARYETALAIYRGGGAWSVSKLAVA